MLELGTDTDIGGDADTDADIGTDAGIDADGNVQIGNMVVPDEPRSELDPYLYPYPDPEPEVERLSRPDYLGGLGRVSIAAGTLILLFCAYQLWGSGLLEWQAQRSLDAEFTAQLEQQRLEHEAAPVPALDQPALNQPESEPGAPADGPAPEGADQTSSVESDVSRLLAIGRQAAEGDPIGRIDIPAIGVSKTFVLGVGRPALRQGPGLYPSTVAPGQAGNTAIAGHRTTHGAPFEQIERLVPGDEITVETIDGLFTYRVIGHTRSDGAEIGYQIVKPSDVGVIGDHGDNRLTLTACHPRFSARERIIVSAALVGEPTVAPSALSFSAIEQPSTPAPAANPTLDFEPGLRADEAPIILPQPSPSADASPQPSPSADASPQPSPSADASTAVEAAASRPAPETDPGATIGADAATLDSALGWQRSEVEPTVLWATVFLLTGFCAWVIGRIWRRRLSYVLMTPIAAVPLFTCFVHLDRLLPAF